jgi:hypothetical protein
MAPLASRLRLRPRGLPGRNDGGLIKPFHGHLRGLRAPRRAPVFDRLPDAQLLSAIARKATGVEPP